MKTDTDRVIRNVIEMVERIKDSHAEACEHVSNAEAAHAELRRLLGSPEWQRIGGCQAKDDVEAVLDLDVGEDLDLWSDAEGIEPDEWDQQLNAASIEWSVDMSISEIIDKMSGLDMLCREAKNWLAAEDDADMTPQDAWRHCTRLDWMQHWVECTTPDLDEASKVMQVMALCRSAFTIAGMNDVEKARIQKLMVAVIHTLMPTPFEFFEAAGL